MADQATVSLLRWLRRQLREPNPAREHLEAAVANDDPGEVRRLLAVSGLSTEQKHVLEPLLERWERGLPKGARGR